MSLEDEICPGVAIILGVTADIGHAIAERLLKDGWFVFGLGRSVRTNTRFADDRNLRLIPCDLADRRSIDAATEAVRACGMPWTLYVSCAGTMEPIGPFFDQNFDAWESSVIVNSTAQLRVLHGVWSGRSTNPSPHVAFLAGGGTNGPFKNYSAYCLAKIALIKACELIDDEEPFCNAFIIGPGYVKTRIHDETLRAGPSAGPGLSKTLAFLETPGTSLDDIYRHLRWCMAKGRGAAGGRNFSTVHDPWRDDKQGLAESLIGDEHAFRLRRHTRASVK